MKHEELTGLSQGLVSMSWDGYQLVNRSGMPTRNPYVLRLTTVGQSNILTVALGASVSSHLPPQSSVEMQLPEEATLKLGASRQLMFPSSKPGAQRFLQIGGGCCGDGN